MNSTPVQEIGAPVRNFIVSAAALFRSKKLLSPQLYLFDTASAWLSRSLSAARSNRRPFNTTALIRVVLLMSASGLAYARFSNFVHRLGLEAR